MNAAAILADIERDELVAELRAEVEHWKALAINTDGDIQAKLVNRLKLTTAEGWALAMLYRLDGQPLSLERFYAGMPGRADCEDRGFSNGPQVIICRLRKKLPTAGFIVTTRQLGYSLTREGIDWIAQLMVDS